MSISHTLQRAMNAFAGNGASPIKFNGSIFPGDRQFVRGKLLPMATEIVDFYDTHCGRDAEGKLQITPDQALETWWTAVNPLPENETSDE